MAKQELTLLDTAFTKVTQRANLCGGALIPLAETNNQRIGITLGGTDRCGGGQLEDRHANARHRNRGASRPQSARPSAVLKVGGPICWSRYSEQFAPSRGQPVDHR
ncbi:hypothetical protein LCM08_14875 [Salipiger pacificus]|nr:hypothetical protein [Alloyangia pacifica]MCA0946200.1 hypothetical protein [Alloyangia pacifica]